MESILKTEVFGERCFEKGGKYLDFQFTWFIDQLFASPVLFATVLFTLGVIFVNGWTDAPNAIATCVATRALPPRAAVLLSAVVTFVGVVVLTHLYATVAIAF